ncbi:MAG TPA: hypothetical protein VL485_10520, partial [Ktedonobacteraceae bacterium]|nr:hypothetical protein [Ktedonobacteraceae bacterium]
MSTYEDRLTALEQTVVTRAEFNQYVRQQGQTLRDRNHEIAMPLGVLTDDMRILKENVHVIRIRMNEGFNDLSQEL